MKTFFILCILLFVSNMISCEKSSINHNNLNSENTENNVFEDKNNESIVLNDVPVFKSELYENDMMNYNRTLLDDYLDYEILNGIEYNGRYTIQSLYGNVRDEVIKYYGVPLEEKIEYKSFYYGATVDSIRILIYEDLTHYIYKFDFGERYARVEINKPLDRLNTINIGDSVEKLIEIFGNENMYNNKYRYNNFIFGLEFIIENNLIIKIYVNYLPV